LRINPQISFSHFDLADPARKFSRLGVVDKKFSFRDCTTDSRINVSFLIAKMIISIILFPVLTFIGRVYGGFIKKNAMG